MVPVWLLCSTWTTGDVSDDHDGSQTPSPHSSAAVVQRVGPITVSGPIPSAPPPTSLHPPSSPTSASFAHKHSVMLLVITVGHNFRDNFKATYYPESIKRGGKNKERKEKKRWVWKKNGWS